MRLPTTVGDPWPRPGTVTFHRIPSVSLQRTGGFCPGAAMPSRVGPRHAGQSAAEMAMGNAAQARSAMVRPAQAQARSARIGVFFIRFGADSLANLRTFGKERTL